MHENKRRALAVTLAAGLLPLLARGDASDDPPVCCSARVDSYRNITRQTLARCERGVRLRPAEGLSATDLSKLRGCIATGTRETRLRLDEALPGVRQAQARTALRAYQAIFESALSGLEPEPDESGAAYEQRQSSLRHAMAHAWARFEVAER